MTRLASILQPDSRALARLVTFVCVLVTLGLAWEGARITWLVWPSSPSPEPPPRSVNQAVARDGSRLDVTSLAGRHLFGSVTRAPAAKPAPIDAPETKLNLNLGGIFHSTISDHSRAMIEAGQQDQELYAVGDELPGGTRIDEIYPDRVILLRNGRHEALTLKQEGLGPETTRAPARQTPVTRNSASSAPPASGQLSRYREEIMRDPSNLQRLLQPVPVTDESGELVGFRVQPGADPGLFDATGLQSGDLVTSIGDVPLTSQESALQAMQQIGNSSRITLTVRRNGSERRILLNFGG